MSEIPPETVEYRTACRLSDQLKLQFLCTLYSFKYIWIVFAVLFVVLLVTNGGVTGILRNPLSFFLPLVFGFVGGFGIGPVIILARRMMGKAPKEIRAEITAQGVKVIGEAFNYETKWLSMTWAREGNSAYLLKFKRLFIRLPKRGFAIGQEVKFRKFIVECAPVAANRLRS